jgi:KDO2-lipid IV(A) lauroyltransferase
MAHRFGIRSVTADAREGTAADRLVKMRHGLGARPIQRGDPREIVKELRAGNAVGMVVDHDVDAVRGVFVPFFGRSSHTVIGPGTFAVRQGVPMVSVRIEWTSLTRHRVTYGPSFLPRTDLPKGEAALELMARVTREVERQIRERPDHWMWLHRRWTTRPEDAPELPVWTGDAT